MADLQIDGTGHDQASPPPARFSRNAESLFALGGKILALSIAATFVPAIFGVDIAWLCAMLALLTFSLIAPLHALQCRSFWLGAVVAVATWFGMFVILEAVADAVGRHQTGEGAMVLLLPMMVFPCVLGLAGIIRLFLAASNGEPKPSPPNPPLDGER